MTREEYYATIPHYCQYPQPDDCSLMLGCWGIIYGYVQERVDYCRVCDLKVMAKRKRPHNKRQLALLPDELKHCHAW